ncbi:MAG: hypothetical protein IT337_17125, partial [Thermomicrobiales bacterium]|nr:hypothetical protein [Thermomicrobiales bacterium]
MSAAPTSTRSAAIVWGSGIAAETANLLGLTDPLLLSPLGPGERVWACQRCSSGYHEQSYRFLHERNGGRCVNCGHPGGLVPVTLPASGAPASPPRVELTPQALVDLPRVRDFIGQAVGFRGYVHAVHRSRQGTAFIKFEQSKTP